MNNSDKAPAAVFGKPAKQKISADCYEKERGQTERSLMYTLKRLILPPSVGEEDTLPSIITFSQLHVN